jgi:hypothetical protein
MHSAKRPLPACRFGELKLRAKSKNRSLLIVQMAVDRHRFASFPALHGTYVALQI